MSSEGSSIRNSDHVLVLEDSEGSNRDSSAVGVLSQGDIPTWQSIRCALDEASKNVPHFENVRAGIDLHELIENLKKENAEKSASDREKGFEIAHLNGQLKLLSEELQSVNTRNKKLLVENDQLSSQVVSMEVEKQMLVDVGQQQRTDLNKLGSKLNDAFAEIHELKSQKSSVDCKSEELQNLEIALIHQKRRFENERDSLDKRIEKLVSELEDADSKWLLVNKDNLNKISSLQSYVGKLRKMLDDKDSEISILKADNSRLVDKNEDLLSNLKAAREEISSSEVTFEESLASHSRIIQLHVDKATEASDKAEELTVAVQELQGLLKESVERYETQEKKFDTERGQLEAEIKERDEAFKKLSKELENANVLVAALEEQNETCGFLEADASSKSKSGRPKDLSFTNVFSALCEKEDEVEKLRKENSALKFDLNQVYTDLETSAPSLQRQLTDYEHVKVCLESTRDLLESEREQHRGWKSECDLYKSEVEALNEENSRLKKQVSDLGLQVSILVREVESARFGGRPLPLPDVTLESYDSNADYNDVITQRLLPFRNIRELQEKNIQLVSVTRELSENQELLISKAVNERTQSLSAELQEAKEKLIELSEARKNHENMVEKLLERNSTRFELQSSGSDILKTPRYLRSETSMLNIRSQGTGSLISSKDSEAGLGQLEMEVQRLREDLVREKDNLIKTKDQLDRAQKELLEAKSNKLKDQSLEEYQIERYRLLEVDVQTKLKQMKKLVKENSSLKESNLKLQEGNIQRDRIIADLKASAKRSDHQIKKLLETENILRAKVTKLSGSLREARTSIPESILEENLKQLQIQLQRSEENQNRGLKAQNDNLTMEVKILQDRLRHTEKNFETGVLNWETQERKLRNELEMLKTKEGDLLNCLREANKELDRRGQQSSSSLGHDGSDDYHFTIDDLETQIRNLKEEKLCLQQTLNTNKSALECFKELASRAETKLIENEQNGRSTQEKFEMEIKTMNDKNLEMEDRIKELESERNQLLKKVQEIESRPDPSEIYREELTEAHAEITRKELELQLSTSAFTKLEKEYKELADTNEQAQHDFEKECKHHRETTEHLLEMRHQEAVMKDKISELLKQNLSFSERLDIATSSLVSSEEAHKKEYDLARDHIAALNSENSILMEKLNGLSQLVQSLTEKETNLNTSLSGEESAEQLMDIIKFLRREKELLLQKLEIADTNIMTFKSQGQRLERELQELRIAYEFACKKGSSDDAMSTKYVQLLESIGTISEIKEQNNTLLRERDTLQSNLSSLQQQLDETLKRVEPMQSESQCAETQISNQKIELETLKRENLMWRQRANQLIEKNHKINPEEVKRLESENTSLKTTNGQLSVQNRQLTVNLGSLNSRLKAINDDFSNLKKAKDTEITQLSLEVAQAKSNLQLSVNKITLAQKKITELEQSLKESKNETLNLKAENEAHLTEIQSGEKVKAQIETLKKDLATKDQQLAAKENGLNRLRNLAKNFKEKAETANSEKTLLIEEKKSIEAEKATLISSKSELENSKATLEEELRQVRESLELMQKSLQESEERNKIEEADALVEQSSVLIDTLERKNVEVEKELERTKKELKETKEEAEKKDEKYRLNLTIAKENITNLKQENILLKAARGGDLESPTKMRTLSKENSDLKAQLEEHKDKVKRAEEESESYKLKYQQALEQASASQSEKVEKSPQETVTASVKPVISATAQANPRKSATLQPQAHIQPTRHSPAQTATMVVRPTAMRSAPPLIRPSMVGDQPQVNVVGPIVSTHALQISDPRDSSIDDLPRALVQPRQTSEEPSPGPSRISEGSTSSCVPEQSSLPSVPENSDSGPQKRSRELSAEPVEEETGGISKKARLGAETETTEESLVEEGEVVDLEADDWLEDGVSAQVSEESVQVLPSETENIAESIEEAVDLVEPITIDEEVDQEILEPQTFEYTEYYAIDPVLPILQVDADSNVLIGAEDASVATEFEELDWQEHIASGEVPTEEFEGENNDYFDVEGEDEQITTDPDDQTEEPPRAEDSGPNDAESTSAAAAAARGRQARVPIVWENPNPDASIPSTSPGARGSRRQGRSFGKGSGRGQRGRAPPS